LDQVTAQITVALDRQTEAVHQLNNRLTNLNPALSGMDWRPAWEKDSSAFYQHQQQQATQWSKQRKQAEELQGRLDNLAIEINNLGEIAADKTTELQRATANLRKLTVIFKTSASNGKACLTDVQLQRLRNRSKRQ
jgi:4-diphosphocytidyl-2C-methyl-D-erythritol kinase